MIDEGYIKFNCDWEQTERIQLNDILELNTWRQRLYKQQLVGVYPNGIGFGNVSQRSKGNQFIITGTQTGNYQTLHEEHYAEVVQCSLDKNHLRCEGLTQASSESMSHYAIYEKLPAINYVFHTHHLAFWQKKLHQLPTTHREVRYGTPEMASEIQRLLELEVTLEERIFLTAGHEEGIFTFGTTAAEAGLALLKYF